VVVGGTARHIVDQQSAGRTAVITAGHSTEALLTSSVPNLQLDLFAGDVDDASAKLDTDRVRRVGNDCNARRTKQKGRRQRGEEGTTVCSQIPVKEKLKKKEEKAKKKKKKKETFFSLSPHICSR
jgi:hypothetical protein